MFVAACGGGGGNEAGGASNVPPTPPPPPPVQNGVFKDRNVSGLAFSSGAQSGTSGVNGWFTCETGNDVSFAIGGVSLGQAACATLITPNQLATLDAGFDLELSNLARFLQMLDEDGDADNGIAISSLVQQTAENWAQVDFRTTDLATELAQIISDAASVDGTPHALPAEQSALLHLEETLDCAYAGAYAGTFSGSSTGAAGMVIGWQAPSFGFIPLGFEWQGVDSVNDFVVFGGGTGSITIRDLPRIDHTGGNLAGPIAAQFITPDEISGTWEGGALEFHRIGADNGFEYRFVGKTESTDVAAYISVNLVVEPTLLDTDFRGEAFDVIEGTTFQLTGTLAGDAVSLTATGESSTHIGTGTMTRHPDGSPDEIQGTFDDGSSFSLAACRLN